MTIHFRSGFQVATYPPGATFGPRRLRDWEFVWLLEGDAEYRRNEVLYPAPQGSLVLCQPPATDSFRWDTTRRTRHAYFHFERDGETPPGWGSPHTWPVVRPIVEGDLTGTLFRHLLAWNGVGDPAQTQLLALSLLSAFVTGQAQASNIPQSPLPDAVATVTAHIARRLDEDAATPLPLSDLAAVACVTPEYLCRIFRRATGCSPRRNRASRPPRPRGPTPGPHQLLGRGNRGPLWL